MSAKTEQFTLNQEKLAQLKRNAQAVRTGGKGTVRRKKKVQRKAVTTDDKKLAASLKRLGCNSIPNIEEVTFYTQNGIRIFKNPKVQAAVQANTFVITGASELKEFNINDLINATKSAGAGDDEMPELVDNLNFETVATGEKK